MSEQQSAPVVEAQRFPAGLFINQPTNHLNTIETSNTPIWWDICQGGSGNQYCCSTYALDVMDEGKFRSEIDIRALEHADCDAKYMVAGSRVV